ncbi:MAG TPA: hypothetical protein VGY13_00905 [Solirubrobacteraceae bacterium]|jgi:hypothetical protein|nr:hypothetical protein [Solirubrobacteraceae bacterium]
MPANHHIAMQLVRERQQEALRASERAGERRLPATRPRRAYAGRLACLRLPRGWRGRLRRAWQLSARI